MERVQLALESLANVEPFPSNDQRPASTFSGRAAHYVQRSLSKLKWLRGGRTMSEEVLRKCFLTYSFPHLAWVFPFLPLLPKTQQKALSRKFRVAMRVIHRAPFVHAKDQLLLTREDPLERYVQRYISKRLEKYVAVGSGILAISRRYMLLGQFYEKKRRRHGSLLLVETSKKNERTAPTVAHQLGRIR